MTLSMVMIIPEIQPRTRQRNQADDKQIESVKRILCVSLHLCQRQVGKQFLSVFGMLLFAEKIDHKIAYGAFCTLPMALRGRSADKDGPARGALKCASRPRQ
jgi:hypothetical protein